MQDRAFLILAPFWRNPSHVGVYRVDRFVRWLAGQSIPVTLVCAGNSDRVTETEWGKEITIKDPLNIHGDISADGSFKKSNRKPNALRRWLAEWLLNPDPTIVWAKRVAGHPLVKQQMSSITDVLASNPPDACHVGAYLLARAYNKSLIVDMRDGWLDEPLKPLLQRSRIRQWQEGRLERKILKQAKQIFVTSEVWKELLASRLPFTEEKTVVLTNAYPKLERPKPDATLEKNGMLQLMHAGRLTGSSNSRKPSYLLRPMLPAIKNLDQHGKVLFLGNLADQDLEEIDGFEQPMAKHAWQLDTAGRVTRERMLQIMESMDGLLLLSTSHAAIPSKFFEYLTIGKPILASTPAKSSVWRIGERLPQVFLVDYTQNAPQESVLNFLKACQRNEHFPEVPESFTESTLSQIFLTSLKVI